MRRRFPPQGSPQPRSSAAPTASRPVAVAAGSWLNLSRGSSGCEPGLPTLKPVTEFSPGLEGVVAAQTAISEVDGANGRLIYRDGYLIEDLVTAIGFEEVAYLLWHGNLPSKSQLEAMCKQMSAGRRLNDSARGALLSLDPQTDPMDTLRTIVSAQGATRSLNKPTTHAALALT